MIAAHYPFHSLNSCLSKQKILPKKFIQIQDIDGAVQKEVSFNPLSRNSDQHQFSPNNNQ